MFFAVFLGIMKVKEEGDNHQRNSLQNKQVWNINYVESANRQKVIIYPLFMLYISNLRYLIKKLGWKSYNEFYRYSTSKGYKLSNGIVQAYYSGFRTYAALGYLAGISDLLGVSVIEMMSVDYRLRDEQAAIKEDHK